METEGHWICRLSDTGVAGLEKTLDTRLGMPSTRVLMRHDASLDRVREFALDLLVFHRIPPIPESRRLEIVAEFANDTCLECYFVGKDLKRR